MVQVKKASLPIPIKRCEGALLEYHRTLRLWRKGGKRRHTISKSAKLSITGCMCNEGYPVQVLHCTAAPCDVDREGKRRAVSVGFASSTTAAKCPRTGGFEHQLAYYSRHSASRVVVGSRHTWLSGGCTWPVIKRIVKVRIASWLLEVSPEMAWHFPILLLLALSDNPPLTSSQPVFSSNLEAHGEYSSTILETYF